MKIHLNDYAWSFNQLKLGIISIDNAEHTLFTPYMMETLSSLGVKPDIINLIHKGTELEDFAAFNLSIEDTVTVCLQRTEELLNQYKMWNSMTKY